MSEPSAILALSEHFAAWMQAVAQVLPAQVIALDGKTVRGSHDRSNGKAAIHMVSAWASANRLVLAQVKVDRKSNTSPSSAESIGPRGCGHSTISTRRRCTRFGHSATTLCSTVSLAVHRAI